MSALSDYIESLSGLKAYYKLDDASGNAINSAPDTIGTNDGTVTGATQAQTGLVGNAYSFDGANDKVTFTGITRTSGQAFSAFALFKRSAGGVNQTVVGVRNGSLTGDLWKIEVNSSNILAFQYDPTGGGANVPSAVTTDTTSWYFAVGVHNGSTITTYVNGISSGTPSTGKTTAAIDQTLGAIGVRADNDAEDFSGLIQHVGYLDRALTENEISQMAINAGLKSSGSKMMLLGVG